MIKSRFILLGLDFLFLVSIMSISTDVFSGEIWCATEWWLREGDIKLTSTNGGWEKHPRYYNNFPSLDPVFLIQDEYHDPHNGVLSYTTKWKTQGAYAIPFNVRGSMPGIFRAHVFAHTNNFQYYKLNNQPPISGTLVSYHSNNFPSLYEMQLEYRFDRIHPGNYFEVNPSIAPSAPFVDFLYYGHLAHAKLLEGTIYLSVGAQNIHSVDTYFYPSFDNGDSNTVTIKAQVRGFNDSIIMRPLEKWMPVRYLSDLNLINITEGDFWDEHEWTWDGKDDEGNMVPNGIYTIAMQFTNSNGEVILDLSSHSLHGENPKVYTRYGRPNIFGNIASFEYVFSVSSVRIKGYVYLNLYDDEFRFIKRLLFRKEIPCWEWQTVNWDFSAYVPGDYYYTIYGQNELGQSRASGGKFTVPEHTITGTKEEPPISDPALGWENEGPIVRVVGGLDILVDSNNDGIIKEKDDDQIEENNQGFVLWENNDNDHWDVEKRYWSEDRTTARGQKGQPDNTNDTINGIHDLEDFFSVKLSIPNLAEGEKFYLEGAPIRVFKKLFLKPEHAKDLDKQNDYLTKLELVKKQHQVDTLGTVGVNYQDRLELKREDFTNGTLWLIFEGIVKGVYELKFYQEIDGVKTNEDIVKITIKDIWDMYKFWNMRVGLAPNKRGFDIYTETPERPATCTGQYYPPNPDKMLVFFHGYNVDLFDARRGADTLHKRLYRAGYRGGFSSITWEGDELTRAHFNVNWLNAFRAAELAKDILIRIKNGNDWHKRLITVSGHSLGNMVIIPAVHKLTFEGQHNIIKKIIHLEAAVPANVYHEQNTVDYFDGSFRANFVAVPVVVNSWSEQDEVLKWAFHLDKELLKLPTPDYKMTSVFGPPVVNRELSTEAMGFLPASSRFPTGLYPPMFFSDWRSSQYYEENCENHPYLIRDHSSMFNEYYLDVEEFYRFFLSQLNYRY